MISTREVTPSDNGAGTMAALCVTILRARFLEGLTPILVPGQIDAHKLLAFAGKQGVSAALAGGLYRAGIEGPYASGLQMMLQAVETANAAKNARMKQALAGIGEILGEAGIGCVALKGGAFIAEDDQAAAWRTTSDLDLLVRPDRIRDAAGLLTSAGYRMAGDEKLYRQEDHQHFPAIYSPSGVMIELHTRALWDPGRDPLDTAEVFGATSHTSGLPGISLPCPADRMIHLVAHCQISDKFYPARKIILKDVLDFAQLSQLEIDWTRVEGAYRRIGRMGELVGFLSACRLLLHDATPPFPRKLDCGEAWANRAVANFHAGTSDRNLMALDIVRDYAGRILSRPGGFSLLLTTLLSQSRLRSLFNTHYRKWKS